MSTYINKIKSLYPALSVEQLYEIQRAYDCGMKESAINQFCNPQIPAEIMSLCISDFMDGYFVLSWCDLDFSHEEMMLERQRLIDFQDKKKQSFKVRM